MQYFQNANSKQILGHSAAAKCRALDDDAEAVEANAGETVTGTSAIARATSIFFMTVSFEGLLLTAFGRPST
jgi:hypothetical protein